MKLAHNLKSVSDLFAKLEREAYRAFHSRHPLAKTDHFYNFCITAHALRDYYFKHKEIKTKAEKEKLHTLWNSTPELLAAGEIANTTKHFTLDRPQKTKSSTPSKSHVVNIYESASGEISHQAEEVFDVDILLSDGRKIQIYHFTRSVIDYWFTHLTSQGIQIRQQDSEDLMSS